MQDFPEHGEIYVHYKNLDRQYKIIGIAKNTETEENMVIYEPLYENPSAHLFARPLKMFIEVIEKEGIKHARFKKVS